MTNVGQASLINTRACAAPLLVSQQIKQIKENSFVELVIRADAASEMLFQINQNKRRIIQRVGEKSCVLL